MPTTVNSNPLATITLVTSSTWTLSHRAHVGYYLFEQGRPQLEKAIGYQPRGVEGLRRMMVRHPTVVYLGGIGLLTGLIMAGFVAYAFAAGGALPLQVLVAVLALIPALDPGCQSGQWDREPFAWTLAFCPNSISSRASPSACRTMVVVPCLIASKFDVTSLTNQMELHYLRNSDPNLSFALLSDFGDAAQAREARRRRTGRAGPDAYRGTERPVPDSALLPVPSAATME